MVILTIFWVILGVRLIKNGPNISTLSEEYIMTEPLTVSLKKLIFCLIILQTKKA